MIQRLVILGLGLIGSSVAKSFNKLHPEKSILGYDLQAKTRHQALAYGIIDAQLESIAKYAPREGDIVIVAVPVLESEKLIQELVKLPLPTSNFAITDVCSVKSPIYHQLAQYPQFFQHFLPAHPIAGREVSGVHASQDFLFHNQIVILCPHKKLQEESEKLVVSLWQSLGSEIMLLDECDHDEILAYTSHLPHLLSFALVDLIANERNNMEMFEFAGGGFRDFSRIASSHPKMWSDIFIANKNNVLKGIDSYIEKLQAYRTAIQQSQEQDLQEKLLFCNTAREHFLRLTRLKKKDMKQKQIEWKVYPASGVTGELTVPGDKSISHRSLIFASLSSGTSCISGLLEGEDTLNTLHAFKAMGVKFEHSPEGRLFVQGVGLHGLQDSRRPLEMGNSGTGMRLLAGLLCGQKFPASLVGDASLESRPMLRILEPLHKMGAKISGTNKNTAPLHTEPSRLKAIDYALPVASAQIKSCILLAGLYADGITRVREDTTRLSRDHSEKMLHQFGYPLKRFQESGTTVVEIESGGSFQACDFTVPSDISSAAFFYCGSFDFRRL